MLGFLYIFKCHQHHVQYSKSHSETQHLPANQEKNVSYLTGDQFMATQHLFNKSCSLNHSSHALFFLSLFLLCSIMFPPPLSLPVMYLSSLSLFQIDLCESRPVPQYKNFQIETSPQGYRLFGTETFRPTLKELLEHLQGQNLRTENLRFQLRRCCPPQPRGTNTRSAQSVTW